ncbi:MAG: hypothetical protein BWY81_00385 [Firmicutes bacterium ADurb.Bin467]|nr:MAG: hypothetical protein BWY81_00385 [Firmicutes bacterium ADurb.Bin467]
MTPREILERLIGLLTEKVSAERTIALLFFVALLGGAVGIYESYTGAFRLSRLSRATELIAKLEELKREAPQEAKDELAQARAQVSRELLKFVTPSVIGLHLDRGFAKAGATFLVWLFLIVPLAVTKPRMSVKNTIAWMLTFSLPCCMGALLIPDFRYLWMDLVIYPIGHVLILGVLAVMFFIYVAARRPDLLVHFNTGKEPHADAESGEPRA